jgi:hypothetical protein
MAEDALRALLASFVIEVDKAGDLAKGNAAIDAMKKRLEDLQAAARPAAKAVSDVFARAAQTANRNLQAIGASQLGGRADNGGFGALAGLVNGKAQLGPERQQLGPSRETLNQAKQGAYQAEQAAAAYAQTLRGKLASAVQAVRAGFNGGSGGGSGPGLIASLATVRNGVLALGAGAAARGIAHLVDGIGDIRESAQKLGVTTDQFQRLRVLAEQNGSSVQSLGTAFRTLANSAVQPTKESTAAFAKLGVSVKDAKGNFKSTNDLFFEVAGALAGVTNETQRSALAQDLLGRSAQELKPLFAGGTEEIEKQRKALASMNVLSEETINQADDLSDSWKSIGPSFLAAAEPLLKILLPALVTLTDWIVKGITIAGDWLKKTDLTSVALVALGAAVATKVIPGLRLMVGLGGGVVKTLSSMAGAGWKAAAPFLRLALGLLILEDIITFLRGGDSETGRLIEKIFGKNGVEVTLKAINDLKAAMVDLWEWVTGKGTGEGVARLWQEFGNGITVMINDLLHKVGIGKGGTDGPFKLMENINRGQGNGSGNGSAGMPAPWVASGPPTADGQRPSSPVQIGDRNISITMSQSASAGDVGRAVGGALDEDLNSLIAVYGGI